MVLNLTPTLSRCYICMLIKIYHNPRCSKSRQTLALLHSHHLQPQVVEYLKTPPTVAELAELLKLLDLPAMALVRQTEPLYRSIDAAKRPQSEPDILALLQAQPLLLQRPIVRVNERACIGRPPENVLEILPT